MQERPGARPFSRVDIDYSPFIKPPFAVKKTSDSWVLIVNQSLLQAKGFTPTEINGAINLEETMLKIKLAEATQLDGLRKWQFLGKTNPAALPFVTTFDRLSALAVLQSKSAHQADESTAYLKEELKKAKAITLTDQLLQSIMLQGIGEKPKVTDPKVSSILENVLPSPQKTEASPFEVLTSPNVPYSAKVTWFENRFLPCIQYLQHQDDLNQIPEVNISKLIQESSKSKVRVVIEWIKTLFRRPGKETAVSSEVPIQSVSSPVSEKPPRARNQNQIQEENPPEPDLPTPPAVRDEYDQLRENEVPGGQKALPIFVFSPGITGYFESDSYDQIDEATGTLSKSAAKSAKYPVNSLTGNIDKKLVTSVAGFSGTNLFSLPLPPGFIISPFADSEIKRAKLLVYTDTDNHYFLQAPVNEPYQIDIGLSQITEPYSPILSFSQTVSAAELTPDITREIERLSRLSVPTHSKLEKWTQIIQGKYRYPNGDELSNRYLLLKTSSARLDLLSRGETLDCYLARELFIAGLKRLNLTDTDWRAVSGHYVSNKQPDGTSHINGSTGHAWVKVRTPDQPDWKIYDPTPPGNPAQQSDSLSDLIDDLASKHLTEQNITQAEQDAGQPQPSVAEIEYQKYILKFAQESGLSDKDALEVIRILDSLGNITDSHNKPLLASLKEQFDRVIGEYIDHRPEHYGPVQMSRGRFLDDPVSAHIDLVNKEYDPTGFQRTRPVEEKELSYGGWDLEIVTDGSSSMSDSLGGKAKYLTQRDMAFLLHTALHQFSEEAQRRKMRLSTPLQIRSSQYMFRGSRIDVIKPLSETFTPPQMAHVWRESAKNIGGGTPAHLGLKAILDRIPPEEEQLLIDKQLLKVVALISDGWYDSSSEVRRLTQKLADLNVVIVEFPITDSKSLQDLPKNVAEKVIESAKQLMPERIRK